MKTVFLVKNGEGPGKVCHAEKGVEIAQDILKDYPISEKKKANIIHCIRSHRFRG